MMPRPKTIRIILRKRIYSMSWSSAKRKKCILSQQMDLRQLTRDFFLIYFNVSICAKKGSGMKILTAPVHKAHRQLDACRCAAAGNIAAVSAAGFCGALRCVYFGRLADTGTVLPQGAASASPPQCRGAGGLNALRGGRFLADRFSLFRTGLRHGSRPAPRNRTANARRVCIAPECGARPSCVARPAGASIL